MIFDITKENYNKTLNNLQNAGFKIDTVPFEFGNMQINQKLKTYPAGLRSVLPVYFAVKGARCTG